MLVTLVAATPFEIAPFQQHLTQAFEAKPNNVFKLGSLEIQILVTGVGLTHTAYALGKYLSQNEPNLLINAGVAGAFNRGLAIGDVVHVISERFADLGVEEANGSFTNIHELGLIGMDEPPFNGGFLTNQAAQSHQFLPSVHGITVHKVHGHKDSIQAIESKYAAEVETMEGAAVFYACLLEEIPFLEIRGISNYVEPRNKDNWDLPLAINNLNDVLINITKELREG